MKTKKTSKLQPWRHVSFSTQPSMLSLCCSISHLSTFLAQILRQFLEHHFPEVPGQCLSWAQRHSGSGPLYPEPAGSFSQQEESGKPVSWHFLPSDLLLQLSNFRSSFAVRLLSFTPLVAEIGPPSWHLCSLAHFQPWLFLTHWRTCPGLASAAHLPSRQLN